MITAFSWLAENWMEIAGTLSALLYLYLSIRENIWLWPVGFVTSFFYMLIFFQSRLYADMGLQVYYLWVSVYGWFHWMGRRQDRKSTRLNSSHVRISYAVFCLKKKK